MNSSSHASFQPKIAIFNDEHESAYTAVPFKTFSGLKKYPSMITFKRNLRKISKHLTKLQTTENLDVLKTKDDKNYFSKHALPYFNRGSKGQVRKIATAEAHSGNAQQKQKSPAKQRQRVKDLLIKNKENQNMK